MLKKSGSKRGFSKRDIEQLLKEQTAVILTAVDNRLERSEARTLAAIDNRLERSEARFNKKLDQLMTTLDRFLKWLTDAEDEFVILKKDVNQIKTVLKEKLGVNLF